MRKLMDSRERPCSPRVQIVDHNEWREIVRECEATKDVDGNVRVVTPEVSKKENVHTRVFNRFTEVGERLIGVLDIPEPTKAESQTGQPSMPQV
jgi:hypothetical protein